MCVMNRPPLTENTNPSGVWSYQDAKLVGRCSA